MAEVSTSASSGAAVRRATVQAAPKRAAPRAERAEAPPREKAERTEKSDEKRAERSERVEREPPARQLQSPAPELSLNVANTLTQNAAEARIRALTIDVNV